jgi:hypothetical protein
MAFAIATQILQDGSRNTTAKTTGDFANSTLPSAVTILDPALLSDMNPGMLGSHPASLLRLDHVDYSISDNLTVQLYWDATTPVAICELYGRGKLEARMFGGYQNNAGAGVTGKILMTVILADQATATGQGSVLLVLRTVKHRPISVGGA